MLPAANIPKKISAILWDYDGTLVNSVQKNINITKSILSVVTPHLAGSRLPKVLLDEAEYHKANHAAKNWQDLYLNYYGLTEREMLEAGALWAEYQRKDQTEVVLFEGIFEIIDAFSFLPQGICSQNSQQNIWNVLKKNSIDIAFKSVVGYEEVESHSQKPHPAGGVKCLTTLLGNPDGKLVMYIGDHEADISFAKNIQDALGSDSRVISVAAVYSGADPTSWLEKPDYEASSVSDLKTIIGYFV